MAKKDELNFENENKIAPSEKLKALQAAMDKIEKSFGKGSIMKMGDESVEQVEQHWLSMPLPKHKKQGALQHSLMQNMHSTVSMLPSWV